MDCAHENGDLPHDTKTSWFGGGIDDRSRPGSSTTTLGPAAVSASLSAAAAAALGDAVSAAATLLLSTTAAALCLWSSVSALRLSALRAPGASDCRAGAHGRAARDSGAARAGREGRAG